MLNPETLADLEVALERIHVPHVRIEEFAARANTLIQKKELSPDEPQHCYAVFGESQSGKSRAAKNYIRNYVVNKLVLSEKFSKDISRNEIAKAQKEVLYIPLSERTSVIKLYTDILLCLGDNRRNVKGHFLRREVYDLMRASGVKLLIIDEVHHLIPTYAYSRQKTLADSLDITNALKLMLDAGVAPIILIGIPEARAPFRSEKQFWPRVTKEINFSRLRYTVENERNTFRNFVACYGILLETTGYFDGNADLAVGDIPACLHEVSMGRLGTACRFIQAACLVAAEAGDRTLKRVHLEIATDEYGVNQEHCDRNPFSSGLLGAQR